LVALQSIDEIVELIETLLDGAVVAFGIGE